MKHLARAVTALALLGLATPALPCGDKQMKTTTASSEKASGSGTVAKSGTAKKAATPSEKPAGETKPATAAN